MAGHFNGLTPAEAERLAMLAAILGQRTTLGAQTAVRARVCMTEPTTTRQNVASRYRAKGDHGTAGRVPIGEARQ